MESGINKGGGGWLNKLKPAVTKSLMSSFSTLSNSQNQITVKPIHTNQNFRSKVNTISTTKFTLVNFLFKFLKEQFSHLANIYFAFISYIQFIPGVSTIGLYTTIVPLAVVLCIAAVKEIYWDIKRKMEDTIINNKTCLVWRKSRQNIKNLKKSVIDVRSKHEFSGPAGWQRIKWKDINQGDIVKVLEDETFPCDMVFISSSEPEYICYVETSNLDGETNLKMKQANPTLQKRFSKNRIDCLDYIDEETMDTEFSVEKSNNRLYDFNGNVSIPKVSTENSLTVGAAINQRDLIPLSINDLLLRGTVLKNSKEVVGLATYSEFSVISNQNQFY